MIQHGKAYQKRRAQEEAALEEKEGKIKASLGLFSGGEAFSRLTEKEQLFINSCEKSIRNLRALTDKQEKWLHDLAARARQEDGDEPAPAPH